MFVKAFVINLERDVERRESIVGQLERLGIEHEIITAVLGSTLDSSEVSRLTDMRRARRYLGRALTAAEIGCSLSHIYAYRRILDQQLGAALVLEDDAMLPEDMPVVLRELERFIDSRKPDLILLSDAHVKSNVIETLDDGKWRICGFKSAYMSSSYVVTRTAAALLSEELYPVANIADCWNWLDSRRVVDLSAIRPPLIAPAREVFGSSTTEDILALLKESRMGRLGVRVRKKAFSAPLALHALYRRHLVPYRGRKIQK